MYIRSLCLFSAILEEHSLKGNKIEQRHAHCHYVYSKCNFIIATRKMTWTCTNWINGLLSCSLFLCKERTGDYIMAEKHDFMIYWSSQESYVQDGMEGAWKGKPDLITWLQVAMSCFPQNNAFRAYIWRVKYQIIRILEKCWRIYECLLVGDSLLSRTRKQETTESAEIFDFTQIKISVWQI